MRRALEARGRIVEFAYFLTSGLASIITDGSTNHSVELGIVGNEGMTGLAVVLNADSSPQETFIQSPGKSFRVPVADLRNAMSESS